MNTFLMRLVLVVAGILAPVGMIAAGEALPETTFYVAPNGLDANPGSRELPFQTLAAARDAARQAEGGRRRIIVMPGEYFLTATLDLDPRDNGLIIEASEAGQAAIHGGTLVANWRSDDERFWVADVAGVREGEGSQPFTIDDAMPSVLPPARKSWPMTAARADQPPRVDGEIQDGEWPGKDLGLDRDRSRWHASGPPAYAQVSYDDGFLYVGLTGHTKCTCPHSVPYCVFRFRAPTVQ